MGESKGFGISLTDVATLGLIGGVVYILYKGGIFKTTSDVGKDVTNITGQVSDTTGRGFEAIGSYFDIWNSMFDKFNNKLKDGSKEQIINNYFTDNTKQIGTTPDGQPITTLQTPTGKNIDILPPGYYQYSPPSTTNNSKFKDYYDVSSNVSQKLGLPQDTITLKSGSTISSSSVFASGAIKAGGTLSSSLAMNQNKTLLGVPKPGGGFSYSFKK